MASAGHSAITSSASGKRSGVAKRERGSTTNGRQPAARATRQSAAAKSTAPKTTSRGGGRDHVDEQRRAFVLAQLGALAPDQLLGGGARRPASSASSPRLPEVAPSASTSSLSPSRAVRLASHDRHECGAPAVEGDARELGLEAHSQRSTQTSISPPQGRPTSQASESAMPKWRSRGSPPVKDLLGDLDHGALDAAAGDGADDRAALADGHLRAGRHRGGALRRRRRWRPRRARRARSTPRCRGGRQSWGASHAPSARSYAERRARRGGTCAA